MPDHTPTPTEAMRERAFLIYPGTTMYAKEVRERIAQALAETDATARWEEAGAMRGRCTAQAVSMNDWEPCCQQTADAIWEAIRSLPLSEKEGE